VGVYTRNDSPYYWLLLERPHLKPLREPTRTRVDAPTPAQRSDNKRLAEQIYHDRMHALARTDAGLTGPRPAIGFSAFADWYQANVSSHKRGKDREAEMLKRLRTDFGSTPLAELTKARTLEWRTARAAKVSAATVNRELDLLKHLLAQAVPKYLAESPIAGLPRLHQRKTEPAILTPAQEARLLKQLEPADRAIFVAALDTLMRMGDILALQREQDHGKFLTVLNPKTGESYQVPVSKRLRRALDRVPKAGPFYFPHRRKAENPRDYRSGLKQLLERACAACRPPITFGRKIGGLTFHALRHTGASRMVAAGVDLRTVQEIGGWTSLRQLSRYAHPTDQAKRRAVEAVGRTRP